MSFTFGIITDTHIRPKGGDQSSPYPVNDLANGRAEYAARLLAKQSPAFTVHLGDVVHPLPHLPTYRDACSEAKKLLTPLGSDVRFVPGNHDIGDKPHDVSPAGPVTDQTMTIYGDSFGPAWRSFTECGVRFIILNSSLINLGNDAEAEQRAWLEAELTEHAGDRTFVFSHYPPFIENPTEPEHYDNYAEPGRGWLLELCVEHHVEAIFSGHVHHFFYNRYKGVKLYCLPATSFTRQDFAELFPVAPAPEFGRDDREKFAVTLIDVEENGHRVRVIPTNGCSDPCEAVSRSVAQPNLPMTPHLRHAWARPIDLPYNGPMEEFSRKRARNDYSLLRLWQMGLSTVRTPLDDLIDPECRARMLDWAAVGRRFLVFTPHMPTSSEVSLLHEHKSIITGLELAIQNTPEHSEALRDLPFPVRLGRIQTSASRAQKSSKFTHNVSFGYQIDEIDLALRDIEQSSNLGVTFQINAEDDLMTAEETITQFMANTLRSVGVIFRLAASSPEKEQADDRWTTARVQTALRFAEKWPDVDVQVDTFMTIDRGYSPRAGLIDRLANLTSAGLSLLQRK